MLSPKAVARWDFIYTYAYTYTYIIYIYIYITHNIYIYIYIYISNNHQPNIKFTYTSRKSCIPFLDLDLHLSEGKLTTNLHIKLTDRHQYLHFTSSYPNHTKRSFLYNQSLTVRRI